MIVTTWNIRGWGGMVSLAITKLLHSADLVCITETWSEALDNEDWNIVSAKAHPSAGNNPRLTGGVAVITKQSTTFKTIRTHSERNFQFVTGTVLGVPILAAYVSPSVTADES